MNLNDPNVVADRFGVSRETIERLEILEVLTRKWTRKINLIGKSTIPQIWLRHIADSMQLLEHAPSQASSWTDLGAGAGFPGLVVAICFKELNPACEVTLVDSDVRKCQFLKTVNRELGLDIDVVSDRIQNAPTTHSDVVSARALAPLDSLLELSTPFRHLNTVCLFPKGSDAINELTTAQQHWKLRVEQIPSVTDPNGVILKIKEVERV